MRDQTRNIETFKVGSNKIDEFAFHKHQGEMHEHPGGERGQVAGRVVSGLTLPGKGRMRIVLAVTSQQDQQN